jgi:uncharacterized damage-inducible protein DinB
MIDVAYVQRMARYNRWQNENLFGVADRLPDEERRRERSAFFGSIHKTLNHLLWGDLIWMSRFTGSPPPPGGIPQSVALHDDWDALKQARAGFDASFIGWADALAPAWLGERLTWTSRAANREFTHPKWLLLTHLFNHQTHHRGQVHCMLTQSGGRPHDTDLFLMPE